MSLRLNRGPRLGHMIRMKFVDPVRGLNGTIEVVVSDKLIEARKAGGLASFLVDGGTITSPFVPAADELVFPALGA